MPRSRGLRGVRMLTGDKAAGTVDSIAEVFLKAKYQRCTVHFYRNALAKVPKSKRSQVATMFKKIHAMKSREASKPKAESVAGELESMRLKEAAKVVREGFAETLTCARYHANIGGASARTTPSSGSTGRSGGVPAWSARSPTENPC